MPASLETGGYVQAAIATDSAVGRRRSMPREVLEIEKTERERQLTPVELAVLRLAKDVFDPPPEWFQSSDKHSGLIANAVRDTARAAFTPRSTVSYETTDETVTVAGGAVNLTEMAQTIVVPIPARLKVTLDLDVECVTATAQLFHQIVRVSSTLGTADYADGFCQALATGFRWPVTTIDLLDLLPEIAYTVTPRVNITGLGAASYLVKGSAGSGRSALICRVEARSLATVS